MSCEKVGDGLKVRFEPDTTSWPWCADGVLQLPDTVRVEGLTFSLELGKLLIMLTLIYRNTVPCEFDRLFNLKQSRQAWRHPRMTLKTQ